MGWADSVEEEVVLAGEQTGMRLIHRTHRSFRDLEQIGVASVGTGSSGGRETSLFPPSGQTPLVLECSTQKVFP